MALVQSGPANPDGTHNTSKLPRIGSRTFRILEAKDNVSYNRLDCNVGEETPGVRNYAILFSEIVFKSNGGLPPHTVDRK